MITNLSKGLGFFLWLLTQHLMYRIFSFLSKNHHYLRQQLRETDFRIMSLHFVVSFDNEPLPNLQQYACIGGNEIYSHPNT